MFHWIRTGGGGEGGVHGGMGVEIVETIIVRRL